MIIKSLLLIILGGLVWAWRGWSKPKNIGGYLRGFITSLIMIGSYVYCFGGNWVNTGIAVVNLTVLEGILGYGAVCAMLNIHYLAELYGKVQKEIWVYLGLISMSYSLLPALFLLPGKHPFVYIIIAMVGFTGFPLAKYVDIRLREKNFKGDAWKIAEAIIGITIIISWIAGRFLQ